MISVPTSSKRYECLWHDSPVPGGRIPAHYWVDHHPEEPHWPDSAVMRWDLRQNDWHKIWPELIDHPCALLFAPRHPGREGAPRFRDWVASWPRGFKWKEELPDHLHSSVSKALQELSLAAAPEVPCTAQPRAEKAEEAAVREKNLEPEDVLEQLAVILLEVNDERRQAIGHHLATLAMAPDSGRIIQALKLAFKK